MTLEGLRRELSDNDWSIERDDDVWMKDGRVFTLYGDGLVYYQSGAGISILVYVEYILLGYGTNELEINFKNETVEVQL